jgi:hypothetical protein
LDIAGEPQTTKWINLVDGFSWIDDDDFEHIYSGVREMLRFFTYYRYSRDLDPMTESIGFATASTENSVRSTRQDVNTRIQDRYNRGIRLYHEGELMLKTFLDSLTQTYSSIVEAPAGTYTVIMDDNTEFMSIDDIVTIDGNDYTVATVTPGSETFTFIAAAAIVFPATGDVTWEPFAKLQHKQKTIMVLDGMS